VTITIDADGLHTQTQSEIREEIIVAIGAGLALTPAQVQRLRDRVTGSLNQLVRIEAEREAALQDALVAVYHTLSLESEGTSLERIARLLGVTRRDESFSLVTITLAGVAATVIPAGSRLQYNATGAIWLTDAEYVIGGGGTVEGVLVAEEAGALEVIAPGTTSHFTILDAVVGWATVQTIEQTLIGSGVETDAELRTRVAVEAYRRGQGPQAAIRAAVVQVTGVTYVGVWESQALLATDTDADGIPARSINVVVEGGDTDEIADAIQRSRAGGIRLFGAAGGTLESVTIELSNGSPVLVQFNRVGEVEIWIDCEITTSTSEETAPPGVAATVETILLEAAAELFDIGDDVLPWKLEAAVFDAELPGIDDVRVELSFDDGAVDTYTRAKRAIAIRDRSVFDATRTTVTEV
jgi:uncharacterized phage protein gp47/JayE